MTAVRVPVRRALLEWACARANLDIAALTVNRWAHGYAPSPEEFEGERPHLVGRKPCGRITIANSDAGARAYLDCAIDEAWRAVSALPS